jgi:hypothetical protein
VNDSSFVFHRALTGSSVVAGSNTLQLNLSTQHCTSVDASSEEQLRVRNKRCTAMVRGILCQSFLVRNLD